MIRNEIKMILQVNTVPTTFSFALDCDLLAKDTAFGFSSHFITLNGNADEKCVAQYRTIRRYE